MRSLCAAWREAPIRSGRCPPAARRLHQLDAAAGQAEEQVEMLLLRARLMISSMNEVLLVMIDPKSCW